MIGLFLMAALSQDRSSPAPKPPYTDAVAAFQAEDRERPPAKGQILFIGSSSFTNWKDAEDYFPTRQILNRAFGGSTLNDQIRWVRQVVHPYEPKQIVIYCGENDLAGNTKLPAYAVRDRFAHLFGLIRARYPKVPIAYVSMKPSPSRWHLRAKFRAGNAYIQEFLATKPKTAFVDVWPVMIGADGRPKQSIFLADKLHMNAAGYRLWAPLIEKVLVP